MSRPAAPESETPETDAMLLKYKGVHFEDEWKCTEAMYDFARSLERRLSLAQSRIAELEKDAARLDWLHSELKLTIAHALHWPVTPQDTVSFRAKIDAALKSRA